MRGIWAELGIASGSDRDAIRRAYARKLRVTNPEDDAEGFKRLRAAYEQALAQADFAARWGDVDEDDEEEFDATTDDVSFAELEAIADPLDRPDPTTRWDDRTPSGQDDDAETITLDADRERDLAALHQTMADLDNALRGLWRAPDADIERAFADLLASPAMGEIAVRDDVERWAARLIANTIPKSDAILAQAVAAFGWNDQNAFRGDYAVHDVLARLEEWRLIAALCKPTHSLHFAWKTLTRKPTWRPLWRIQAFSPSLTRGIRTLFGEFGPVSPGLHFSFNAASVERWQAFFAKPRLTSAMLLLAVAVWTGVHLGLGTIPALQGRVPYAVGGVVAVLSLAAPWIALRVARGTRRLEQAGKERSEVFRHGWVVGYIVMALIAILFPPMPVVGIAVIAAGLLLLGWIVVAADPATHTPVWPALGSWLMAGWVYVLFGIPVAMTLPAPTQLMLGTVAMLALVVRATMVEQVRRAIDQLALTRPLLMSAAALLGIGALAGLATWARIAMLNGVDAALFVGVSLALLAILPGLAMFDPRYRRQVFGVHIALAIAFVSIAAPLMPAPKRTAASEAISQESVLDDIKRQRPNLEQLQIGNPDAWAEITSAAEQRSSGAIDDHAMSVRIDDAIDAAYRARLPTAPAMLVAEAQRIKLVELLELRKVSIPACAHGDMAALKVVPESLQLRLRTNVYAVAAWPVAEATPRAGGTPAPAIDLVNSAARIIDQPVAILSERLKSKAETAEVCDARIAMLQALVGYPDDAIAATIRMASKTTKAGSRK